MCISVLTLIQTTYEVHRCTPVIVLQTYITKQTHTKKIKQWMCIHSFTHTHNIIPLYKTNILYDDTNTNTK